MQGLVFTGSRTVALREVVDPTPGPGDVVLAMRASGICGSDLNLYRRAQASTVVCGHEPCGVVVGRGAGVSAEQYPDGMRVMVHHYRGCMQCWLCRMGYTQMCARADIMGTDSHGGNAPYMVVPTYSVVELPAELSFEEGAAISCGTGTAYAALKRLGASGRDVLVIFGQGPVGLSATQLATAMGALVIAVDPSAERRELACGMGAVTALDSSSQDVVQAIRELTHGEGADATLDCSGNAEARANCAKAARAWGRACFVGAHGTATFDMTPDVIHKQLTMHGSWTFNPVLMAECAQFAVDRRVPLGNVFTHRFELSDAVRAYELVESQTVGKGVFTLGVN